MITLVIISIILVVSYGINIYVEENNKEVTKKFIKELEKQNEILIEQNTELKNYLNNKLYKSVSRVENVSRETFLFCKIMVTNVAICRTYYLL